MEESGIFRLTLVLWLGRFGVAGDKILVVAGSNISMKSFDRDCFAVKDLVSNILWSNRVKVHRT